MELIKQQLHRHFFKKMKHNIILIFITFVGLSPGSTFAQSDTILVGYSQSDFVASLIVSAADLIAFGSFLTIKILDLSRVLVVYAVVPS